MEISLNSVQMKVFPVKETADEVMGTDVEPDVAASGIPENPIPEIPIP